MKSMTVLTLALCASMFSIAYSNRSANVLLPSTSSSYSVTRTAMIAGWLAISHQVGSFFGALFIWPLSIFLGRKAVLMGAVVVAMIGGILGTASDHVNHLFVSYGLTGFSSSVTMVIANLWMVENSPAKSRGQRVILMAVAMCVGAAVAEWVIFGAARGLGSFRIPFGLQFVFQIPTLVLLYLAPESYRWLLNHDQPDKARSVLTALDQNHKIRGTTHSSSTTYFDALIHHQRSCSTTAALCSCFTSRHPLPKRTHSYSTDLLQTQTRRRLFLIFGIQLIPIFSGTLVAQFYLSTTLQALPGNDTLTRRIITAFLPTFDIIFQLPPFLLISRFGIRKLLVASTTGMALCHVAVVPLATIQFGSFTSFSGSRSVDHPISAAILAFSLLFYIFYNLGLSPIPWLLQSELTPSLTPPRQQDLSTALPALATALRYAVGTAMMFANAQAYGMGPSYLLIWIAVMLAATVLIWALYPETQERKLEELDRYIARGPKVLVGMDAVARKVQRCGDDRGLGEHEAQEMSTTGSPRTTIRHEQFKRSS